MFAVNTGVGGSSLISSAFSAGGSEPAPAITQAAAGARLGAASPVTSGATAKSTDSVAGPRSIWAKCRRTNVTVLIKRGGTRLSKDLAAHLPDRSLLQVGVAQAHVSARAHPRAQARRFANRSRQPSSRSA